MTNKGRNTSNDELSLWERFVEGITPLKKRTKPQNSTAHKTPVKPTPPKSTIPTNHHPHPPTKQTAQNQLDRATLKKLQSGKLEIEGRIDLHGKNQDEAYHALKSFLTMAFSRQKRCVLVITGKGGRHKQEDVFSSVPHGHGVLKTMLPHWLSQPPLSTLVLRHEQATKQHGGSGAFYVYLKRNRHHTNH